ncbi:MAG: DUF4199 domain-containing protein [Flavobacterium sp.]
MNDITTQSPAKAGLTLGLIFGLIMIFETIIGYVMNIDPVAYPTYGLILNFLNYLILPLSFIYIGCTNFKKMNGGFASFGECLKVGVSICVIAGLVAAIFSVVFNAIFPEYVEELIRKTRAVMLSSDSNMTEDQVEMAIGVTRKFMSPYIAIPSTMAIYAFIGLIYSLIVGAIVKNDRNQSF